MSDEIPSDVSDVSEGGDALFGALGMEEEKTPVGDSLALASEPLDPKASESSTSEDTSGTPAESDDCNVAKAADLIDPDPPEPPPEFYKCKKGHVTEGLWVWVVRESERNTEVVEDSGAICRICHCRWMGKMFPAKRTAPPKVTS